VAVDRRNERLYVNDSWAGLYRIGDWAVPRLVPCTTSARQRLTATDLTISNDNQLYIQEGPSYSGPITRWGIDNHYLDSLPFPNSGRNELTHYIYGRMHGVGGFGEKGIAVAPDKKVASEYLIGWCPYMVAFFADSGCLDDSQHCDTIITPINLNGWGGGGPAGGLRFDSRGNLYMGAGMRSAGHVIPAGFETDYGYSVHTGAVIRFPAGVKGSIQFVGNTATAAGSDRIYPQGLSPFSSTNECPCRSPRFDIDPYDRLYLPHAVAQKVSVADNNGNTILEFGDYGNWDSRGPGSPVPTADVPFAWPVGAAATDNFIYVTDMVNTRVVRVSKTFVLDNLPGWPSSSETAELARPLSLAASPNPFSPVSRIRVGLPSSQNVRLEVFDARGRLVRTIKKGALKAGYADFAWNGCDAGSRPVAPGLYIYRLAAGGKVLNLKTVMVK
jgi:hypothetical protein